jgi:hypothetical protein
MTTEQALPGVLAAHTDQLMVASDTMAAVGREMVHSAGGAGRKVPPLPDDRHGLVMLIVQFDEARERYERRIGERLRSGGAALMLQTAETTDADDWSGFEHFPEAGR